MSQSAAAERIRPVAVDDLAAVRDVHLSAFVGGPAEANLVGLLHAADKARPSLLAESRDGVVLGHIVFSPVHLDGAPRPCSLAGLGPLAVRPEHQGMGVGSRLVRAGLAACVSGGSDAVVVLGSPAYYGRFGFRPAAAFGFSNEYAAGDDFMILEAEDGSLSGLGGLLKYAPEFAAAGC